MGIMNMTKQQKLAQKRAEEYAQKKAAAEQAAVEHMQKENAPYVLEQIEQEIEHDYGITDFNHKSLSDEIPNYLYEQWRKYNDIVNPTDTDEQSDNDKKSNAFGIDFGKSAKCEKKHEYTLDDMYAEEFQEEPEIPADAPPSVRPRNLPSGYTNIYDPDDDFSFDETDDDADYSK